MSCPVCKSKRLTFIFRLKDSPQMQQKLHRTLRDALQEKRAEIDLRGCNRCGFVFNSSFREADTEYSTNYDNTQDHSTLFQTYLINLARRLKKKYLLENKRVVEVGCGKGYFLKIMHALGLKQIIGFDPSYVNYDPAIDKFVVKKFFNKKECDDSVDFIICRHVLEHIEQPLIFVQSIAECLKNNGTMYFEFPRLEWIIENEAFFDFFYEHCNYFTKGSATELFEQSGFNDISIKYGLGGQYLQLEVRRGSRSDKESDRETFDFGTISEFIEKKIDTYRRIISSLNNFAIWGAGAKGITFANRLGIDRRVCKYFIDINPNKQNKFVPITGQKIVSPDILKNHKINTIIIMNPVYTKEIKNTAKKYNYAGKFITL